MISRHACTAASALVLIGTFYKFLGPRVSLIVGSWTYALYGGSLLNFNRTGNGAFVIAGGALLGFGAAFFWVSQGTIMLTYCADETRGLSIGIFWVVFNLGATVGSLASFGINYHSKSGTVSDSTYVAYIVIMLFGWALSILVCPSEALSAKYRGDRIKKQSTRLNLSNLRQTVVETLRIVLNWRIMCLYPMFYTANVFYSYQQNSVNGKTFNLRSRSLNSALYWIAQMVFGLLFGMMLDVKSLNRRTRAIIGWVLLFVTGMAIWGGGYSFQLWNDPRLARGLKQDIDYKDGTTYVGPMFLYFFYGGYDAIWQAFCYWLMGAQSRNPIVNAIVVSTYTALKPAGGAMAWRINAESVKPMTQFAMNWGLTMGSLVVALPMVVTVRKQGYDETGTAAVEADTVHADGPQGDTVQESVSFEKKGEV